MSGETRREFLTFSGLFLLGVLVIALALAAWAGISPLSMIRWSWRDVGVGVAAAIGMATVFGLVTPVRDEAEKLLGPALASCRWHDLLILALLVGTIEELLFRGVLEPWAARIDPWFAFVSVNLLFGLLHAVSVPYAMIAALLGAILSCLAYGPGEFNLLRPMVAHGVYDYIGFVWLARNVRNSTAELISNRSVPVDE